LFTLSACRCGLKVSCSEVAKSKNGSGQIGWVVNFGGLGFSVVNVVVLVLAVDRLVFNAGLSLTLLLLLFEEKLFF